MAALMRGTCLLVAAACTALSAAQQGAGSADPVLEHFRAYRAALERNDLPAAETAAAAALAASEAASGARTAVLALNLANLRLELGDDYDALTPARTAHALATSAADSGLDHRLAALTLGRAELAADERDGARRLAEAIAAAQEDAALAAEIYPAAIALGEWTLGSGDYVAAEDAWRTAGKLAATTADPTFARARALIGEGTAIFLSNAYPRETQTGTRMVRVSTPKAQAANDAFAIAQALLLPSAYAETPPGAQLTAGQLAYAQAMAWQGALVARLESLDEQLPGPTSTFGIPDIPAYDRRGQCRMQAFNTGPDIRYPAEALLRYGVGAVVARFALDADGRVRSRAIAASIPPGPLAEAVEKTLDNWRIEKDPSSPASCRFPPAFYFMVRFVLN